MENNNNNNTSMYKCERCSTQIELKSTDTVRCKSCGYRVLSKLRTKKIVTYLAR